MQLVWHGSVPPYASKRIQVVNSLPKIMHAAFLPDYNSIMRCCDQLGATLGKTSLCERSMFTDLINCSTNEVVLHIDYLKATPVHYLANDLESGKLNLRKGFINNIAYLGTLKTIFKDIGGITALKERGRDRFIIEEIIPLLEKYPNLDKRFENNVRAIIEADRYSLIEFKVTVFNSGSGYIVVDGNKRAIAFFNKNIQDRREQISFLVYVLNPSYYKNSNQSSQIACKECATQTM